MNKLILVCLMMLTGSAWAEWVMYEKTESSTSYYDPATIRKDGNMRRVWQLNDLRERNTSGVMSRRIRQELDCKQESYRILAFLSHSEPMAGGTILESADEQKIWRAIPPNTVAEALLKIVCAK